MKTCVLTFLLSPLQVWRTYLAPAIRGAPAIDAAGIIYITNELSILENITDHGPSLFAVNSSTGALLWIVPLPGLVMSTDPVIGPNRSIVLGVGNSTVLLR